MQKRKRSANVPTYKAIKKQYDSCPDKVQKFFTHLTKLLNDKYPYEIILAYMFLKTEQALNQSLYCGVTKIHKANSTMAKDIINKQHITREFFQNLFKDIYGHEISKVHISLIEKAEKTRDNVIHGKKVAATEMREAIVDVLKYAQAMNENIKNLSGIEPFGTIRGAKGAGKSLDKNTTRWLLKGLGFNIS